MADIKWIKIVTDIFDDEKMYAIECMPDGKDIELIWFKILCLAGKCNKNGFLIINDKIAYTDEMLAKIFRMEIGVVQRALDIFQSLDMIEVVENAYMISNWLMYQSGDRLEEIKEKNKARQQRFRDSQKVKALLDKESEKQNRNVTNNVTNNVTSSYSYSNNSNKSNYLYILENLKEEYIDYLKSHEDLLESVKTWLQYKDERKPKTSNHYEETGLKSLLKKVVNMSKAKGYSNVIDVIEYSISNNYAGIIWDRLEKVKKGADHDEQGLGDSFTGNAKRDAEIDEIIRHLNDDDDDEELWQSLRKV